MTSEEIVETIDFLNLQIADTRNLLSHYYRQRRDLRRQLEQNHRPSKPKI